MLPAGLRPRGLIAVIELQLRQCSELPDGLRQRGGLSMTENGPPQVDTLPGWSGRVIESVPAVLDTRRTLRRELQLVIHESRLSQNGYGETVITLIVCRFSVSIAYTSIDHGIDGLDYRSMGDGPPMGGFSRGRPNPEGRTGGPTAHRRQWCNPGTRLRLRTPRAARKPPGKVPDAGGPQGSNRPLGIPGIKGGSGGAGGPPPPTWEIK